MYRLGIDIGSTTAKFVLLDKADEVVFKSYGRHNTQIGPTMVKVLKKMEEKLGDIRLTACFTGSIGMGISDRGKYKFVQEVIAAGRAIKRFYPESASMIDIGGEDAKVVLFGADNNNDLRMNGNCAGGTGAFIDQMSILLNVEPTELSEMALKSKQSYSIASRCGVFSKTDIQNLLAKQVERSDIAASIFKAVALQTITTLYQGSEPKSPILFCGGPLTYLPALRKAFVEQLGLEEPEIILPELGLYLPALGSALSANDEKEYSISSLTEQLLTDMLRPATRSSSLSALFENKNHYEQWTKKKKQGGLQSRALEAGIEEVYIGIDSGSTTTKLVVMDAEKRILFHDYRKNNGNALLAAKMALTLFKERCDEVGCVALVKGSFSTGYGEDLIKSAFSMSGGMVETVAHYGAALHVDPEVSFILDIGGQDMKAMFINNGIMERIEINEACSSGCGSFIETFALSLGHDVASFARLGCGASAPSDLGTRCTVFMNSKVKQEVREGASASDISAGLAYSVVRNCLYKVLKLNDVSILGKHIVVQGGSMKNDAVVRALELETGLTVGRMEHAELMGAIGCALEAMKHEQNGILLTEMLEGANYSDKQELCQGCNNGCAVTAYRFDSGNTFYSGNKCEKVYHSQGERIMKGENALRERERLLFKVEKQERTWRMRIGIPRVLNMYEEYQFWYTLFTECDIEVVLSGRSRFEAYERSASQIMSDNVCFPAKLVHSHVDYLIQAGVERIFMPFVVHEQRDKKDQNSYNCPIVSGYNEIIKSVSGHRAMIDTPSISFKDDLLLRKQLLVYLKSLGIDKQQACLAISKAHAAYERYKRYVREVNEQILQKARHEQKPVVMLASRPYHADSLIEHQISEMISGMGVHVMTEDYVRGRDIAINDAHYLAQWTNCNRIMKAASWCSEQPNDVQLVQLTSFGCGPDAFIVDEVRSILARGGKSHTLLKIDDINNIGSMRLRIRSMTECLKMQNEKCVESKIIRNFETVPVYDSFYKDKVILAPFFTPFISPLIPAILGLSGYKTVNLPSSDKESGEWGLKYANNEVCYPATLIVGDVIKAFKSGKYDPKDHVVGITQTGGQCRASNYISLIKKGLIDAGYKDVPVVSIYFDKNLDIYQPGFNIDWKRTVPYALKGIVFSDCISKMYHATLLREREAGGAAKLRDKYLSLCSEDITERRLSHIDKLLEQAAKEFDEMCLIKERKRVGIVGEIYLKFNPYAHRNITEWLSSKNIEVAPPMLLDFFMQTFANRKINVAANMVRSSVYDYLYKLSYYLVNLEIKKADKICRGFKYYEPFENIFHSAARSEGIVSGSAQFGEGWLLPSEIISYAERGIEHVISLQPFGCIANHIVSKGIQRKITERYPQLQLLSLDFDGGISEVNVTNRVLLFLDDLLTSNKERQHGRYKSK